MTTIQQKVVAIFPGAFEQVSSWLNWEPTTGFFDIGSAGFRGFTAADAGGASNRIENLSFAGGTHRARLPSSSPGKMAACSSATERFEVDGANAARDFLQARGIGEGDIDPVWDAIALHTTPGIPRHKKPVVALVTQGVEMDVLGLAYGEFACDERDAVVLALAEPGYRRRLNFYSLILGSAWNGGGAVHRCPGCLADPAQA